MVPTNLRLLRGIRALGDMLEKGIDDPAHAERAHTINIILDELIKRQDGPLYATIHAQGMALAQVGDRLARERGLPATDDLAGYRPAIDPGETNDIAQQAINRINIFLSRLVGALSTGCDSEARAWIDQVLEWEAALWRAPAPAASVEDDIATATMDYTPARVEAYLQARFPDEGLSLAGLRQIPGGFSKMTSLLQTIDTAGRTAEIILRAQKPIAPFFMDGADIGNEYSVLRFCHRSGLPVAKPLWLEMDGGKLGLPFLATTRIPGRNHGDFLGSSGKLPIDLVRNLVETMARVHNVPIDPADPLLAESHLGKWAQHRTIAASTRAYIAYWQDMGARGGCSWSPALARGFDWLLDNVPECDDPPTLVHGDFGLHNVMVEENRVSGILDWEACYIGDPADEFHAFSYALSNTVSQDQILQWYVAAGRRAPSLYRRRYYAVLQALKGPLTGIAALNQVDDHAALDLKPLEVSYRFVTPTLDIIADLIRTAEAAREMDNDQAA